MLDFVGFGVAAFYQYFPQSCVSLFSQVWEQLTKICCITCLLVLFQGDVLVGFFSHMLGKSCIIV